jgi:hypothetical protein
MSNNENVLETYKSKSNEIRKYISDLGIIALNNTDDEIEDNYFFFIM